MNLTSRSKRLFKDDHSAQKTVPWPSLWADLISPRTGMGLSGERRAWVTELSNEHVICGVQRSHVFPMGKTRALRPKDRASHGHQQKQ